MILRLRRRFRCRQGPNHSSAPHEFLERVESPGHPPTAFSKYRGLAFLHSRWISRPLTQRLHAHLVWLLEPHHLLHSAFSKFATLYSESRRSKSTFRRVTSWDSGCRMLHGLMAAVIRLPHS